MRKLLKWAAIFVIAAFLFLVAFLPPRPVRTSLDGADGQLRARTVRGAYHVHTTRSDGADGPAAVAAAAARAGLQFVIFAEHGDGTRPLDPPVYLSGVLCIDGVEISTNGGHYVALGLPAAPYPLGGDAAAVVEDVRRLGGFGVAAHPLHPRPQFAWADWTAPIDGIEWINADAEWRDESAWRIGRVLAGYLLRPGAAVAQVFDRPATLDRWHQVSSARPVVALAAADAHGGARRGDREDESRLAAGPSYEASFASLSNRVILEHPLTGEAPGDARRVLEAIRNGDVYSVVDAISPDVLLRREGPSGLFVPASPLHEGAQPQVITEGTRARLEIHSPRAPGAPAVPWVLTNWSRVPESTSIPEVPPLARDVPLPLAEWRVEHERSSSGRVSGAGNLVTLDYRLGADQGASPFVAAAVDLRQGQVFDALAFRGRAGAPMRVSVQLRYRPDDRRWLKSVYLGPEDRDVVIRVGEMVPAEGGAASAPLTSGARSILFIVDLVNAKPGAAGSFTVSGLRGLSLSAPR